MPVFLKEALPEDAEDILVRAMSQDPLWTTLMGSVTFEQQVQIGIADELPRLTAGRILGACKTWKAVDENG